AFGNYTWPICGSLFWPTLGVNGFRQAFWLTCLREGIVVAAVGMWESRRFCGIPKGGGKGGKPGFGFPPFPWAVISTATFQLSF
ncbi:MAG: hypothetical protein M3Y72_13530, partial [Acidobacteriota bacterium]|nr:hypothetical protein [Acidobacteriota bacterium]